MAAARQEMGPDAMLVNSRKAPPEARHLGEYEVVFAIGAAGRRRTRRAERRRVVPAARTAQADRLSIEVAELKKELEGMRRAITRSAYAPAQWIGASPDVSDAYAALTAAEVSAELAREIVQAAGDRVNGQRSRPHRPQRPMPRRFQRALVEETAKRALPSMPTLGRGAAQPRIVALVGPPGSGKTTTLVKLAVNYGWPRAGRCCCSRWTRIGSPPPTVALLRRHPRGRLSVLETVSALAQAIEENRGKELILIDTPGFGLRRHGGPAEPGAFLSHARRYRHAPGPAGLDEGRRPGAHGGRVRNLPAAAAAVYQAR